jgi:acyl dehydratase
MAATTADGVEGVQALVGRHLGYSDWVEVTQEQVDRFADATGDHQWIHVDVERARAESPFGGPIAHGYLTLSLLVPLLAQVLTVRDAVMGVNYGLNKVRFPSPVPVGSKVRATASLTEVTEIAGGLQYVLAVTVEREGGDKPVCVAEPVYRVYGG